MGSTADNLSRFMSALGSTCKSLVKIAVNSRRVGRLTAPEASAGRPIVVMGNGPSLEECIKECGPLLKQLPTMAVNFAANTPEFFLIRPDYYILADPHFFKKDDAGVAALWATFAERVDWPMTLLIPAKYVGTVAVANPCVTVSGYNPVGVEGFGWFERWAYGRHLGMPRPRNVLIPAIMEAISLGFSDIYIVGADHSWMRTLSVDDSNRVVSIQPHYYSENEKEKDRIASVYSGVRLHDVISSFYVAFRAYHRIADYARHAGVAIYNSTPGSMIDAFERRPLPNNPKS